MPRIEQHSSVHWSTYIAGVLTLAAIVMAVLITLKAYQSLPHAFENKNLTIIADTLGKEAAVALLFLTTILGTAGTYKLSQLNNEEIALENIKGSSIKPDVTNRLYILSGRIGANHNKEERVNARREIITPLQEKLRSGEYFIVCHDIPQEVAARRAGDKPRTQAKEHYYLIIRQGKKLLNSPEGRVFLGEGRAAAEEELNSIFQRHNKILKRYKQVTPEILRERCPKETQEEITRLLCEEGKEGSVLNTFANCVSAGFKFSYNGVAGAINSVFSPS